MVGIPASEDQLFAALAFARARQHLGDKVIGELSRALTNWNAGAATSSEVFDTFCAEFDLPADDYDLLSAAVEARIAEPG